MDQNKIIDAMQAKTQEIFEAKYSDDVPRGVMAVQILTDTEKQRWSSTFQAFGTFHMPYFSLDTTVHEKMAYTRRTGKNSGAPKEELIGQESHWEGAIISADGKCICAFSGYDGSDDVLIAQAGLAVYEAQK